MPTDPPAGPALQGQALRGQALWIEAPGRAALRAVTVPPPGRGEIRVRTLFSGVSRGTESLVYRGMVPESEYRAMRCPFQEGEFPAPVKYGYASVGLVESAGPDSRRQPGERVFCLYPHQTHYTIPVRAALPIPPHIPPERAVLAANMETALNAVWDGAPRIGDRVAVVGAGVVGSLLAALLAGMPAADVTMIDTDPGRAAFAKAFGISFCTPADAAGDCDLVFHASGAPAGLRTALAIAGFEARIVELSWYGTGPVTLTLGAAFHSRRLQLIASQVGHVATARRGRCSRRRRLSIALGLLDDPRFDSLLVEACPPGALPARLAGLASGPALCQLVRYGGPPARAGPAPPPIGKTSKREAAGNVQSGRSGPYDDRPQP